MSIQLTYGDDADQTDIDSAILRELGTKQGYVIQLTFFNGKQPTQDVVIERYDDDRNVLVVRAFDESAGEGVGDRFEVNTSGIDEIKIY